MAHDAIRGDVLRALPADGDGERADVRAELGEHAAGMRDKLAMFAGPDAPPAVRAAAEQVTPSAENHLRLADTVVQAGPQARGTDTYFQFGAALRAVEDELPAVGDALKQ
jgi:methyl-accepting chemotaxis protein